MKLTSTIEQELGREFGQRLLNNYRGFRSWNQLNTSTDDVSSDTCECCSQVRESLISNTLNNEVLLWLVDVRRLHLARRRKGEARCGFCCIVYQQFWAWQSPMYRLKSQLWAERVRRVDVSGGDAWSGLSKWWEEVVVNLPEGKVACFLVADGNTSKTCSTRCCNICYQDNYADLEFGRVALLCEACRSTIGGDSEGDAGFRPVIPLMLKPTIITDGSSLSTVDLKHAAGIAATGGQGHEWLWAMYTVPGMYRPSTTLQPYCLLAKCTR